MPSPRETRKRHYEYAESLLHSADNLISSSPNLPSNAIALLGRYIGELRALLNHMSEEQRLHLWELELYYASNGVVTDAGSGADTEPVHSRLPKKPGREGR